MSNNIKKILVASFNPGKVREIKAILANIKTEFISLDEFLKINNFSIDEAEETGSTFVENAQIKAKYYAEKTGLPALADDSGLSIDEFGGAPGVYSANWLGSDKDYNKLFEKLELLLAEKNVKTSRAYFTCVLSLYLPEQQQFINFEGKSYGTLTFPARGKNNFGYDPIFIPEGFNQTFAEMEREEKEKFSHRGKALNKFKEFLLK